MQCHLISNISSITPVSCEILHRADCVLHCARFSFALRAHCAVRSRSLFLSSCIRSWEFQRHVGQAEPKERTSLTMIKDTDQLNSGSWFRRMDDVLDEGLCHEPENLVTRTDVSVYNDGIVFYFLLILRLPSSIRNRWLGWLRCKSPALVCLTFRFLATVRNSCFYISDILITT